ncbi:glucose-6-phosphate dehydrogenase [Paraburkholderia caballeronis]|uniref:Glucose-6-phosphate 1-dehydrogenase n=1 Tax=Paraburkholderia caballeronis TaxID=416943 RepID=A0A1H7S765_9BURK|nr:glucose-6-phosphate dehydrogenase [Paraburkholderia caballeronis]PXW22921.1 glucose-6-phosphate 1-dehydrogenase [Paraburkholderia caballeronis]PXW97306.1 glucose-6-phosphate 1-dehydrogenase [Paraburkholderia caballeronis]RAJ93826.1 glucose-6-phosphate 1-dehydrogenase [Paraburkholderia caballeronis]TDV38990.1 glucose-6-phosphate 1-dehydrogenase [Paraburkholderia caballeronis]SED56583.1 glucose-6-phosphate 1-dehydrogenase [Paraburkholderia caballeronis]
MTNQPAQAASDAPVDMIIFGGAGDLAARKLLPALYMAHLHRNLPPETRILAVGRRDWSIDQYRQFVDEQSRPFIDEKAFDAQAWDRFLGLFAYVRIDVNDAGEYQRLVEASRPHALRVFYLSTSPELFTTICDNLASAGLVDNRSRVVLEKPLGHDLASAQAINESVGRHFGESQIYRIDHYLGKETVQNLMVLRFGNPIFGPLWQAPYIRSVQITVAETVGVGSRAGFYDHTGALRDMVQNHLLQLLCIVAMEPPVSLDPDAVRDEKLKVLRSLRPMSLADIARDTVRGQYAAGAVDGAPVKGYLEEDNVPADSRAETFVALRAHINNWRWANVPFFLRTGKRLQKRQSEIVIDFADLPFSIIPSGPRNYGNRLVIQLQPEESIQLQMLAKEPGSGMSMVPVSLNLDLQQAIPERRAEAYERLLIDVIRGRLTHFMRRDELEAAWTWVEPILDGWQQLGDRPRLYTAGTFGPAASSALLARENMAWAEEA